MTGPGIVVLAGGTSSERQVSLGSGQACAAALARFHPARLVRVDADALPAGLDPEREVVFSTLHGTFGEDGGMQRLLEQAGIEFAGCDSAASALAMDKARCKAAVSMRGVEGPAAILFSRERPPDKAAVLASIGADLVMKPNAEGSSVGLRLIEGADQLAEAVEAAGEGEWLIERRIRGRELSVGVIGGRALGVVEIRPRSGVYDYSSKYTKGLTEYFAPAPISAQAAAAVQSAAESAFAACGCRDYARVDFILSGENRPFFLEINTLPGMKETSLLPMSARCVGLDFGALVRELVDPALARFHLAAAVRP